MRIRKWKCTYSYCRLRRTCRWSRSCCWGSTWGQVQRRLVTAPSEDSHSEWSELRRRIGLQKLNTKNKKLKFWSKPNLNSNLRTDQEKNRRRWLKWSWPRNSVASRQPRATRDQRRRWMWSDWLRRSATTIVSGHSVQMEFLSSCSNSNRRCRLEPSWFCWRASPLRNRSVVSRSNRLRRWCCCRLSVHTCSLPNQWLVDRGRPRSSKKKSPFHSDTFLLRKATKWRWTETTAPIRTALHSPNHSPNFRL